MFCCRCLWTSFSHKTQHARETGNSYLPWRRLRVIMCQRRAMRDRDRHQSHPRSNNNINNHNHNNHSSIWARKHSGTNGRGGTGTTQSEHPEKGSSSCSLDSNPAELQVPIELIHQQWPERQVRCTRRPSALATVGAHSGARNMHVQGMRSALARHFSSGKGGGVSFVQSDNLA